MYVGMQDIEDPWIRGQIATPVGNQVQTLSEVVSLQLSYLDDLEAGRPFGMRVDWIYQRFTSIGRFSHFVNEVVQSPAVASWQVIAPPIVNSSLSEALIVARVFDAQGAAFTANHVLCSITAIGPDGFSRIFKMSPSGTVATEFIVQLPIGAMAGILAEEGRSAVGKWRLYLTAQSVNQALDNMPPMVAKNYIGGAMLASPAILTLQSGFCPHRPADASLQVV
jgi:hypothetical protein